MLKTWFFAQCSSFCNLSSTSFHHFPIIFPSFSHHFPITSPWFPIISLGHKLSLPGGGHRVRLLGDLQLHPIGREVGLQGGAHQLLEPENDLEQILGPKEKVCMHIISYHIKSYYIYIYTCACMFSCAYVRMCVIVYIYIYYLKKKTMRAIYCSLDTEQGSQRERERERERETNI